MSGKKGIATAAVVVIVVVMAMLAVIIGAQAPPPGSNGDALITKANASFLLTLDDLGSGWTIDHPYLEDHYDGVAGMNESGSIHYNRTSAAWPIGVEAISVTVGRFNTTADAITTFDSNMGSHGANNWQGNSLTVVGAVEVGDQAVLCTGNWTSSHGAIKTLVFRENNVIVLLVYEAAENVGLTNQTVIELCQKIDARMLS